MYEKYVEKFFADQKDATTLGHALIFLTKYEAVSYWLHSEGLQSVLQESYHEREAQKYLKMLKSMSFDGIFAEDIEQLESLLQECFPWHLSTFSNNDVTYSSCTFESKWYRDDRCSRALCP